MSQFIRVCKTAGESGGWHHLPWKWSVVVNPTRGGGATVCYASFPVAAHWFTRGTQQPIKLHSASSGNPPLPPLPPVYQTCLSPHLTSTLRFSLSLYTSVSVTSPHQAVFSSFFSSCFFVFWFSAFLAPKHQCPPPPPPPLPSPAAAVPLLWGSIHQVVGGR